LAVQHVSDSDESERISPPSSPGRSVYFFFFPFLFPPLPNKDDPTAVILPGCTVRTLRILRQSFPSQQIPPPSITKHPYIQTPQSINPHYKTTIKTLTTNKKPHKFPTHSANLPQLLIDPPEKSPRWVLLRPRFTTGGVRNCFPLMVFWCPFPYPSRTRPPMCEGSLDPPGFLCLRVRLFFLYIHPSPPSSGCDHPRGTFFFVIFSPSPGKKIPFLS